MHEQLHMIKFNRATSLVGSTSISFEEIAQLCGYHSVQYLYTVFRKNLDTTPGDYRLNANEE